MTASERNCCCCSQFDIGVTICVGWHATPLNKSGKGFKIFFNIELLYPFDEFQTNWIFYREHAKQKKTSLLSCGRHGKSDVFVFCFSIKYPICLKLVKCFCWYSASTKTSLGFCACSELLQLDFGRKKVAWKCKLLSPQDSYRGD